jgi:uncharacterized protein YkwD
MSPASFPRLLARPVHLFVIVALCAAMVLAAAINPGRAQAQTTTQASTGRQIAVAMLALLNRERGAHRLAPVTMSAALIRSAYGHNLSMARANTMSHQLPGEAFFGTRISATGYIWRSAGENVAWNSQETGPGATFLQLAMYNEVAPNNGHRLNILSPNFRNAGISVYFDNLHHKMWITQDFGQH